MKTTAHTDHTSTTAVATLEIEIEELEQIMALEPVGKLATNHNETFVHDEGIGVSWLEN